MTCPACGQGNAEGAKYCSACGSSLETTAGGADDKTLIRPASHSKRADDATVINPPAAGPGDATVMHRPTGAAPATGATALTPGQRLGERYEVLDVLGEGGFGAVYRARDLTLDRVVALKVMRPELVADAEIVERFKREILLASQITHKNVVRIHDLGEADGVQFISMAFIEGSSLSDLLKSEGRLSVQRTVEIGRQICEALQAAHDAGVVHRDLKPANILLDREGNAYIADFGISRSADQGARSKMTETGTLLGTVAYMSPEQARGQTPDQRSDLYALGLMLYEMLTGDLPFEAENPLSALMMRTQADAPTVDATRAGLPPWITRIVGRALARDVADRYQSAAEILQDLEQQRATVTIRRRVRRRVLLGASGVALLALLVVLSIATYNWWQSQPAEEAPAVQASLILAPFHNATQDSKLDWIETGLPDLLRAQLQQSRALQLVGAGRVREVIDGLKLDLSSEIDPADAQRIAGLIGIDSLITGNVFRMGEQYRIDARLYRAGTSGITADTAITIEGRGEDALFSMVDDLGRRIRDELGISSSRGDASRRTTELSTESVEALRHYSEGLALVRSGSDVEAAKRLAEAVEADPEFALARIVLAETYENLGKYDDALAQADQAAVGLPQASQLEAARIRAVRARLTDDIDGATAAYDELSRLSPNDPETQLQRAQFQELVGDLDGALESLDRVIELDPKNPSALYTRGRVRVKLGTPAPAIQDFEAARALHVASGNDEGRATVLLGLGNTRKMMGEFDEALVHYEAAQAVRESIGDLRGVGVVLNNMSLVYQATGDFDRALEAQRSAIEAYQRLGDDRGQAIAYANLGDLFATAGRPTDALDAYNLGLDLLRRIGDAESEAHVLGSVAFIHTVLGDYNMAYPMLKQALRDKRQRGDSEGVLRALVDIGFLEQIQGSYDQALQYYAEGLELSRDNGDQRTTAVLSTNLSQIHREQGKYGNALQLLAEAEQSARQLEDAYTLAAALSYIGRARCDLGDLKGAETALDEAIPLARETGVLAVEAEALIHRGVLLLARGDSSAALAALRDAQAAADRSEDYRLGLLAKLGGATAAGRSATLVEVIDQAETKRLMPIVSVARLALAQLHLRDGRAAEALSAAQATIAAATPLELRDVLLQANQIAAGTLAARGDTEGAARHAAAGLTALEQMLDSLDTADRRQFLERPATRAFTRDAADLLAAGGRTAEAERAAALDAS